MKVRRNIECRERHRDAHNSRTCFQRRKKKEGQAYNTTPSPPGPLAKKAKEEQFDEPMPTLGDSFPTVTPGQISEEQLGASPALVAAFKEPVINQETVLREDLTHSQLALCRLLKTGSNDLGPGAQLKCKDGLHHNKGDMTEEFEKLKANHEPSVPSLNKIKEVE